MQERSAETRGRLLDAAMSCFGERGYDGASVADICARAQVSKGAFYHHFASKQDVFLELMQRWLTGIDTQIAALRAQTATAPEALLAMVAALQQVLDSAQGRLPLFFEFLLQAQRDATVWRATVEPFQRYHLLIADLLRQGIAEHSIEAVDADVVARMTLSLAIGVLVQSQLTAEPVDWASTVRESLRLVLATLEPRGERAAPTKEV